MAEMSHDLIYVGGGRKNLAFLCWATDHGDARPRPLPGSGKRDCYENAIIDVMMRRGAHAGSSAESAPGRGLLLRGGVIDGSTVPMDEKQ